MATDDFSIKDMKVWYSSNGEQSMRFLEKNEESHTFYNFGQIFQFFPFCNGKIIVLKISKIVTSFFQDVNHYTDRLFISAAFHSTEDTKKCEASQKSAQNEYG